MIATDIEALHAELDANPSCQFTRRILADAYEDAGVMWMADGLRWMAERSRAPWHIPSATFDPGWQWIVCDTLDDPPDPIACHLPRLLGVWKPGPRTFLTRRAAEEQLCHALAGSGITQ